MGCMQSFNLKGEDDGKDDGTGKSPGADKGNAKLGEDVVFGYQTDIKSKYKVRMEWEYTIIHTKKRISVLQNKQTNRYRCEYINPLR